MFKFVPAAGAALALTFAAASADAATTFTGNVANVTANTGSGLIIQTGLYNSFNFTLNEGEVSAPVGLFTIWTPEGSVEWGEDTVHKDILVNFAFSQPNGPWGGGPVQGDTFGFRFGVQNGVVTWDAPVFYTFGNGGKVKITLAPTVFNLGLGGLNGGPQYGAVVSGKFELISDAVSAVPEPATWAMMISGFGLAGVAIRRRRTIAAIA